MNGSLPLSSASSEQSATWSSITNAILKAPVVRILLIGTLLFVVIPDICIDDSIRWLSQLPTPTHESDLLQVDFVKYRNATVRGGACGITVEVEVTRDAASYRKDNVATTFSKSMRQTSATSVTQSNKAFFKSLVADNPLAQRSEWHIREIMASYLDDMLGTDVVPPSIGYRLPLPEMYEAYPQSEEDTACFSTQDATTTINTDKTTLSGALIKWVGEGVQLVKRDSILAAVKSPEKTPLTDSAVRYAIFYYLAGCSKSNHNHFLYQNQIVSIDNDRCFVPHGAWIKVKESQKERYRLVVDMRKELKRLALHDIPCDRIPKKVIRNVLALSSARRDGLDCQEDKDCFSSNFKERLQEDALADDMLSFLPATYEQLDRRIDGFVKRIQQCGFILDPKRDVQSEVLEITPVPMIDRLFD